MSYEGPERREYDVRFKNLEDDMKEIKDTVKELHESFMKAQGAITFVKIVAAVAVAGAGLWAWVVAQINTTPRI